MELGVEHVSAYALTVEREVLAADTPFSKRQSRGALQSADDALSNLRALETEVEANERASKAAHETLRATENQYRAGTVSYLNVVAAQTTALSVERTLLDARNRQLSATNLLLKNLAGDWR